MMPRQFDARAETLRQMRAVSRAIEEAASDCLLAGDLPQAHALAAEWWRNVVAITRARGEAGEKSRLRRSRLDLTTSAIAERAAEICEAEEIPLVCVEARDIRGEAPL